MKLLRVQLNMPTVSTETVGYMLVFMFLYDVNKFGAELQTGLRGAFLHLFQL